MYGLIEREDEPFIAAQPENWDHTENLTVEGDFEVVANWKGEGMSQGDVTRMLNEMTQVMDRYRGMR